MLKKAFQSFQAAVKLDPEYDLAYVFLGKAFKLLGDSDAAIASFKKALELNDKLGEALYILGLTYLDKGEKKEALNTFSLYKQKYYDSLPGNLKQRLDALIRSCREKP